MGNVSACPNILKETVVLGRFFMIFTENVLKYTHHATDIQCLPLVDTMVFTLSTTRFSKFAFLNPGLGNL